MKRVLLVLIGLAVAVPVFAVQPPLFRLGGGYSYLLTPDLDDVEDAGADVTKGGVSFGAQALLGRAFGLDEFLYGIEAGYVRAYEYEFEGTDTKVTLDSIPVMVISEYRFNRQMGVGPFIQGGIGAAFNSAKTETALGSDTEDTTDFALMAGPGFTIPLSEKVNLDAMLKYYVFFTEDDPTRSLNLSVNVAFQP